MVPYLAHGPADPCNQHTRVYTVTRPAVPHTACSRRPDTNCTGPTVRRGGSGDFQGTLNPMSKILRARSQPVASQAASLQSVGVTPLVTQDHAHCVQSGRLAREGIERTGSRCASVRDRTRLSRLRRPHFLKSRCALAGESAAMPPKSAVSQTAPNSSTAWRGHSSIIQPVGGAVERFDGSSST